MLQQSPTLAQACDSEQHFCVMHALHAAADDSAVRKGVPPHFAPQSAPQLTDSHCCTATKMFEVLGGAAAAQCARQSTSATSHVRSQSNHTLHSGSARQAVISSPQERFEQSAQASTAALRG